MKPKKIFDISLLTLDKGTKNKADMEEPDEISEEEDEDDSTSEELVEKADTLMTAITSENPEAVAAALKSFINSCNY